MWVAEHGNAAPRDTMFSPEVFNSPYGGGIPIASIESLYGVVAHLTGLHAGTVTYLVATPVGTALAVWATWRLCRRWAPRRAFLALLGAIAFLMLCGDSMLGNFWIVRDVAGQGHRGHLPHAADLGLPHRAWSTRQLDGDRRGRWRAHVLLLLAAGVAFFGLTPTAVVWAPVMFGAVVRRRAAGALVAARARRGAHARRAHSSVVLAVVLFSTDVGGEAPVALRRRASFVRILGEAGPMVALGRSSPCAWPPCSRAAVPRPRWPARRRWSRCSSSPRASSTLINTVTGSGPILWRMLYVAPIPVLAGLLLSPWPDARGASGPGATLPARHRLLRRGRRGRRGRARGRAARRAGARSGPHTGHGGR